MVEFERFILDNGLPLLVHRDDKSPVVAFNLLYDVGARDEAPEKTGFAHLFEHLMFEGSLNIPVYDEPLERAGGENNAFTNNDITNYYIQLPENKLEIAFWLESDRMLGLELNQKKLDIQKEVVIQEYNQRYLNRPYGDIWLLLRPLAYKVHPYRWPTIGKDISHIKEASLEDVKSFFYHHYAPNNAVLSIAGDVNIEEVKHLALKWFGGIENRDIKKRDIQKEPPQQKENILTVERDVPVNAIYKAYHMCSRTNRDYYATDLLSDILSNGDSSRLYSVLVKEMNILQSVDAFITGQRDEGLFMVTAKIKDGISVEEAEKAIDQQLSKVVDEKVSEKELQKVKNKVEANITFSRSNILNKSYLLAYHENIWEAERLNHEVEYYKEVNREMIRMVAASLFKKENCSTLYYLRKK